MKRKAALNDLVALVEGLSEKEKRTLANRIMDMMRKPYTMSESTSLTCNKMVKEHIEAEIPNCPHCQAKANLGCIIKRGFKNGVQRFYCKSCGRYFFATSNTVFEKTRKNADVWTKFIELTISGASLQTCSEECKIAYQTAFTWRHKILNAFRINQSNTNMSGQIQIDEMLIPISYKGNHVQGESFNNRRINKEQTNNNMPRKAYKRGTDNKSTSSKDKACVFCMVKDGSKGFYAAVPGVGFMTNSMLDATIGKHVKKDESIILADQYKTTANYLGDNNYSHTILAANTSDNYHDHKPEIQGDKHLQHVNAMHRHLRRFLKTYCGVSTKYLENYISLYVWLKNVAAHRQKKHTKKVSISRLSESDCYITRKKLEAFPAIPVCA